jgi:hypothetical protein
MKAVRKTRDSQVTSLDKLARLQAELSYPLELTKLILNCENVKKECIQQGQELWEKQLAMVDLKHKYPVLGDKRDEEILIERSGRSKNRSLLRTFVFITCYVCYSNAHIPPAIYLAFRYVPKILHLQFLGKRSVCVQENASTLYGNRSKQRWRGKKIRTIIGKISRCTFTYYSLY